VIIHDVEQGSAAWLQLRLGIPTASNFHRIITAVKGDLSKSARKYAAELVAETLLGRPLLDTGANVSAMQRGRELEPAGAAQYEFTTDVETRLIGFVTTDDGRIGCSPDRFIIGQRGGVEIKCQLDGGHMACWLDGPGDDYRQQVQGTMAVCEAAWWELYAYHPELPPLLLRTERDETYIAKMRAALAEFLDMRDEMLAKARQSGFFAEKREAA
jgi:hypothetical protein